MSSQGSSRRGRPNGKSVDLDGLKRYVFDRLERELAPALTYHCVGHTRDDVLPAALRLAELHRLSGEQADLLAAGALLHDLGFIERRDGHELVSAAIAREVLPGFGFDEQEIETVVGIIMATRLPQTPRTQLERLMADADLDVLGRDDFLQKNQALRAELAAAGSMVSEEQWLSQQVRFLEHHSYFTELSDSLHAAGKQQNLRLMRLCLERLKTRSTMTASPPETWIRLLRSTALFGELDEAALSLLTPAFRERTFDAEDIVVRQGEHAESLFVVLDGRLEVFLERDGEVPLPALGPGDVVGEMALILGGERSATVRATEVTRGLELSRDRFDELLEARPDVMAPFSRMLHTRMRRVKMASHLHSLFGQLDPEALQAIEREVTWVHLASGQELFRQGDPADGAYIVAVGRLRVVVNGASGERTIDEIGPGQWVGEMALLTRSDRSATVYAVRDTELVFLPMAVFDKLIAQYPQTMLETSRRLVLRLQRQMGDTLRPHADASTLAIVPITPDVDVETFARELADALSGYGSVLRLTKEVVDERLGKKGIASVEENHPAHLRLAPWLIEQEHAHRFVLYQGDPRWSGWTDRAIRNADHVLVVADGRASPNLGEIEQKLAARWTGARAPKRSLVLLQPPGRGVYAGTATWLRQRQVDSHFHVRRGSRDDVGRIARMLTGNAICVVLGGGASRGYAHIGVLRAFEELNIPIDAVAGTSIGAVIAAAAALGLDSTEILQRCAPILARFLDPTLPLVSLMSGKRAIDGVTEVAGQHDIEDVVRTFFCVSTNLTRGHEVVHRRGNIAFAVRASGSVPGLFPPVPDGTDLLVDGGLSNNVPADTMAAIFGGVVVAVDVIPEVDLLAEGQLPLHLSGWEVAWRGLNPLAAPVGMPNIVSILMRSVTTASHSLRRAEEAQVSELYLRPPVDKWNILDFKSAVPIADQGYAGTIQHIREWWDKRGNTIMGRS